MRLISPAAGMLAGVSRRAASSETPGQPAGTNPPVQSFNHAPRHPA